MGTRKAAVLPEPVWAQDMRSLLARMMGIECFWTGVGLVYLASSMFPFITAVRFNYKQMLEQIDEIHLTPSKSSIAEGTSEPVASTGMSS